MRMAGGWARAALPALALTLGCAVIGHTAEPAPGNPAQASPPQSSPPQASPGGTVAPQDEALALVREMSALDPSRTFLGSFRTGMINTLVERSKLSPEQAARAIDDDFMPIYTAHFGELEVKLAAIWAKHFTPAEIQGLRDSVKDPSPQHQEVFKSTSLGRKYIGELPDINHASALAAREWGVPLTCQAFKQHGADLVKLGVDPKLVELPPGACPS